MRGRKIARGARIGIVVGSAIALLGISIGVAVGSIPGNFNYINACRDIDDGALRVIDYPTEHCKSGEAFLRWNGWTWRGVGTSGAVGAAGPSGPPGPAGPRGIDGGSGPAGPAGIDPGNVPAGKPSTGRRGRTMPACGCRPGDTADVSHDIDPGHAPRYVPPTGTVRRVHCSPGGVRPGRPSATPALPPPSNAPRLVVIAGTS